MIEKPDLPDETILRCLRAEYALPAQLLTFLPVGNDSRAWSYRVDAAGGERFFLKLRSGDFLRHVPAVTYHLRNQGLTQVVAPLPTRGGLLWAALDPFHLLLYPYIEGECAMRRGLMDRQWSAFGTLLRQIHAARLPEEVMAQVPVESFRPPWAGMVTDLQQEIDAKDFRDPYARELAEFWRGRGVEIAAITARAIELGERLRAQPRRRVLCHADIHTANLLVDPGGGLHVVDWDGAVLAPKERDLIFVGDPGSTEGRLFYRGYGAVELDRLALAYYSYEWVVQEIGDFGERVFRMPDLGDATRAESVAGFKQLFALGDVVEAAYHSAV